ncbi:MAG: FCD domain-containing protein, partial [Pseudonocardia sp.]
DTLGRLLDRARRAHAAGEADAVDVANTEFHEQIYRLGRNRLVPEMLGPLTGRLRWLFRQNVEHERVLADHARLHQALRAGDPEQAAAVALEHIQVSRRMVLQMLTDD